MPGDVVGWEAGQAGGQAWSVTTRIGFGIIIVGVALIVLRWIGFLNTEGADIASVMAVVLGALAVAIDGERADG